MVELRELIRRTADLPGGHRPVDLGAVLTHGRAARRTARLRQAAAVGLATAAAATCAVTAAAALSPAAPARPVTPIAPAPGSTCLPTPSPTSAPSGSRPPRRVAPRPPRRVAPRPPRRAAPMIWQARSPAELTDFRLMLPHRFSAVIGRFTCHFGGTQPSRRTQVVVHVAETDGAQWRLPRSGSARRASSGCARRERRPF